MNTDNTFRRFRYIEAKETSEFLPLVTGWLQLAEEREPGTPKAVLEGDWVAHLPDGSCFKEVAFKTEHHAVEQALPDWARRVGRRFASIEEAFLLNDGSRVPLDQVRFTKS